MGRTARFVSDLERVMNYIGAQFGAMHVCVPQQKSHEGLTPASGHWQRIRARITACSEEATVLIASGT